MRRRRRPDLFPADRALQARMLVAIAVALVLMLLLLGWIALFVALGWAGLAIIAYGGVFVAYSRFLARVYIPDLRHRETEDGGWYLAVERAQQQRLEATAARLCPLADVDVPICVAYPTFLPQSYTLARLRRRPTLYVSAGMLRALDDRELDAVVAHEISHIANRDALLMTLLLAPASLLSGRVADFWAARHVKWDNGATAVTLVVFFFPVLFLLLPFDITMTTVARALSRQRELYADHCAAVLTGSPACVATTLMKLSGERGAVRLPDLRLVGGERDEFHILPDRPQPTGIRRIWATHPPVLDRAARLQDMERDLQSARLSTLRDG